jgi:uncharacterized pyridoxamine 5'-phosphate oxidase family protein
LRKNVHLQQLFIILILNILSNRKMKRLFKLLSVTFIAGGLTMASASNPERTFSSNVKEEQPMKEVYDFLKKCEVYFLATVDGDQPRVRPFGSLAIYEDRIYFLTGKRKNVSKQIGINPKIEICALDIAQGQWLRIEAVAVNDDRREAKEYMLDQYPELKAMYSPNDDNTQVLYLTEATATFSTFTEEPKVVKF